MTQFSDLLGLTLVSVERVGDERIEFTTGSGDMYTLQHHQDCCESVGIESVVGDLSDLIGTPILRAEEATNSDTHPNGVTLEYEPESYTWTFYKLATKKGYVDIRWYGTSNGYYSESVGFDFTPFATIHRQKLRQKLAIAGENTDEGKAILAELAVLGIEAERE